MGPCLARCAEADSASVGPHERLEREIQRFRPAGSLALLALRRFESLPLDRPPRTPWARPWRSGSALPGRAALDPRAERGERRPHRRAGWPCRRASCGAPAPRPASSVDPCAASARPSETPSSRRRGPRKPRRPPLVHTHGADLHAGRREAVARRRERAGSRGTPAASPGHRRRDSPSDPRRSVAVPVRSCRPEWVGGRAGAPTPAGASLRRG